MAVYPNGFDMQVGDHVLLYHKTEFAEIEAILESYEAQAQWGLSETGIVFRTSSYELVVEVMESLQSSDDIEFVSRRARAITQSGPAGHGSA